MCVCVRVRCLRSFSRPRWNDDCGCDGVRRANKMIRNRGEERVHLAHSTTLKKWTETRYLFSHEQKNYILWKHTYKSTLLDANCNPWVCALLKLTMKMAMQHVAADTMCVYLIFTNCLYSLDICEQEILKIIAVIVKRHGIHAASSSKSFFIHRTLHDPPMLKVGPQTISWKILRSN